MLETTVLRVVNSSKPTRALVNAAILAVLFVCAIGSLICIHRLLN